MKISEFALNLFEACRNLNPEIYHPSSLVWHCPGYSSSDLDAPVDQPRVDEPDICYICLGGALIASKRHSKHTAYYTPREPYKGNEAEDGVTLHQMLACEYLREGNWRKAAQLIGANPVPPEERKYTKATPRWASFQNWKRFNICLDDLEERAKTLQAEGY